MFERPVFCWSLLGKLWGTHYWIKLIIHTHSNYNLKPLWTRLSKQFNRCNTLGVASTQYLFSLCFKLFKGSPLSQRSDVALNRNILCVGDVVSRTELGLELLSPETQLYCMSKRCPHSYDQEQHSLQKGWLYVFSWLSEIQQFLSTVKNTFLRPINAWCFQWVIVLNEHDLSIDQTIRHSDVMP